MRYNTQPYNRTASFGEDVSVSHHMTERLMGWAISPMSIRFPRLMFNLQPYNRPIQTVENITVNVAISENLKGWLRIGADYTVSHRLSEQINGDMRIAAGRRFITTLKEVLTGNVDIISGIQITATLNEFLSGALHVGADIKAVPADMTESLIGFSHMGADIYHLARLGEDISGLTHLGANIYIAPALYEVLNGYANIRNIVEYITTIIEAIPPGAVLVIDTANYTMTLQDGEIAQDVIHWHKGDWLQIGRGTISFTLSGIGADTYSWEVFYHALYL